MLLVWPRGQTWRSVLSTDPLHTANQRIKATLADGSYWVYQYDSLGQVTSGQKYWSDDTAVTGMQFGYWAPGSDLNGTACLGAWHRPGRRVW